MCASSQQTASACKKGKKEEEEEEDDDDMSGVVSSEAGALIALPGRYSTVCQPAVSSIAAALTVDLFRWQSPDDAPSSTCPRGGHELSPSCTRPLPGGGGRS